MNCSKHIDIVWVCAVTMTVADLKESTDQKMKTTADILCLFWHIQNTTSCKIVLSESIVGLFHFYCRASLLVLTVTFSSSFFSSYSLYLSHLNFVNVFLFSTLSILNIFLLFSVTLYSSHLPCVLQNLWLDRILFWMGRFSPTPPLGV